ncbi:MAG: GH3 auxin-responsive promoter family protein [Flavobacteriaceae bacterium]|nr:GH3 auxin-responsive promoter family protein [Flavobacteriaceae bacterium]
MKIPLLNTVIAWSLKKRKHQMELFLKYPIDVQYELLSRLIDNAKNTEIGVKYNFSSITDYESFATSIPIKKYESIEHEIKKTRKGNQNIFWNSNIKWFAKSSGTTNAKSKFIPVSEEALENCHYKAVKDMLCIYVCNNEETRMFNGKSLRLGGSSEIYKDNNTYFGDLSAIIIENLPLWADFSSAPSQEIALMSDWETKMDRIIDETLDKDITSLAGVPSWMLVLLNKILERTGKQNILEVWPNLEVYFHGGVNFSPYHEQYKKLIPKVNFKYYETYNASEGFFAIQDKNNSSELLLMLDYGIFYEFIPMSAFNDENSVAIPLEKVELHKNYALVITTNAGLWRYLIGDTIRFTSLSPYRIKVTGRTKHFINAFGEELIIENADTALKIACQKTNATILEFTVAPIFMTKDILTGSITKGSHEWLIEFSKKPTDLAYFTEVLDNSLKAINSDYEAKRYLNITLEMPKITIAKKNLFYNWLKKNNKLGGQHKVPRLANNRHFIDELIK